LYRWIIGLMLGGVVLVGLISGCGGGSEDSESLTKAEYVKAADKICAERKKTWETALASYDKQVKEEKVTTDPEAQEEIAETVLDESMVPAVNTQLEQMEELEAPTEMEQKVTKMLTNFSGEIEEVEKEGVAGLNTTGQFGGFVEEAKALGLNCQF